MKYIDTHAHLNLTQFDVDRAEVFSKCQEEGVGVINVGTRQETSQLAVDLAKTLFGGEGRDVVMVRGGDDRE